MNEGHILARTIGRFGSSVDSKVDQARYVEEYMKKNHHPPFPETWQPLHQRGQNVETYIKALEYFYTMYNGMEILYLDVCKCIFSSPFPSELDFRDMEDQDYDSKAVKRGEECPFNTEQQEGMKNRDTDTVTGLLLQTMSDCYFKKRDVIEKVSEIHGINKRFSEFALKDFEEMEVSQEKRKNELSPLFDHCLDQLNEDGLKEVIKKLYIKTWKQHVEFDEKEFTHLQNMDDMTKKYFDAMKATEDKYKYLSSEVRKHKKRCMELENTNKEQRGSISRYKNEMSSTKKENDQLHKKNKDNSTKMVELQERNVEIQQNRADLTTTISQLKDNLERLRERYNVVSKEVEEKRRQLQIIEDSNNRLQHEDSRMKRQINDLNSTKETLLTRLSEVAGDKLTIGNTEITDLSDPDRPTKLGERFREMYDNEWTEALEEILAAGLSDKAASDFLLDVMMKTFRFCSGTWDKIAANCLRCLQECYQEIPAPDSKDLQLHVMIPSDGFPHEGETRKGVEIIRRDVAANIKSTMKKRCFANIEKSLQMTLQRCSGENNKDSSDMLQKDNKTAEICHIKNMPDEQGTDIGVRKMENVENQTRSESHSSKTASSYPLQQLRDNSTEALNNITEHGKKVEAEQDDETQDGIKNDSWQVQSNSKGFTEGMDRDTEMAESVGSRPYQEGSEHDKVIQPNGDGETGGITNNQSQDTDVHTAKRKNKVTEVHNATAGYDEAKMQLSDENSSLSAIPSSSKDGQTDKKSMKELYPKFYKYSWKSFNLCWLMRLHSPGLHLDDKIQRGSDFDSNRFRHYTQTGKKVDYLVWPALHLHEGGPLLAKGVAQPIKDKTRKSMAEQQT